MGILTSCKPTNSFFWWNTILKVVRVYKVEWWLQFWDVCCCETSSLPWLQHQFDKPPRFYSNTTRRCVTYKSSLNHLVPSSFQTKSNFVRRLTKSIEKLLSAAAQFWLVQSGFHIFFENKIEECSNMLVLTEFWAANTWQSKTCVNPQAQPWAPNFSLYL